MELQWSTCEASEGWISMYNFTLSNQRTVVLPLALYEAFHLITGKDRFSANGPFMKGMKGHVQYLTNFGF